MRWIATTAPATPVVDGSSGSVYLFDESSVANIPVPSGCTITARKPSYATWVRGRINRKYICGAGTDNLVMTEGKRLRRLSIGAPTGPLVNSSTPSYNEIGFVAAAGGGITGLVIPYLRFYDEDTGRRSPLSAGGPEITLTNNGLIFFGVPSGPDEPDAGVTHVEVWASVDGGLPRFWFRRDIGAPTFSGNDPDLGEAELGSMDSIPVCKYVRTYHDRIVMAGDELNPERLYFSALGLPEQYEGLWIATKNGEPIIGLFVVRDVLIVQCENSHYSVQGYDEDDIRMDVLEPFIGGLGHHTVVNLDQFAILPTKSGWKVCDGTSMVSIGEQFNSTWADEQHWVTFDESSGRQGWCSHDAENKLIKYKAPLGSAISPKVGLQTVNGASIYWIIDYTGLIDGSGGVDLMFDTAAGEAGTEPTSGAMLTDAFGERHIYTGHADGKIAVENVHGLNDLNHNIGYYWQSPQVAIAHPGDDSDCAKVTKQWVHISNEDVSVSWTLFAGNGYEWQSEPVSGFIGGRSPDGTATAAAATVEGAPNVYRDRVFLHAEDTAGSSVSILISKPPSSTVWSEDDVHPAYVNAPLRADGVVFPAPMLVIKGWGFTYEQFGYDARGVRPQAI